MASDPLRAENIQAKLIEFLWRNRIPKGMISVIFGRPDQGKGLLASRIVADVTQQGINCLYSAAEDGEADMTKPRLEAAGADLSKALLWSFVLPRQMDRVEKMIVQYDLGLVIIDPFNAHLSDGISRYSDNIRVILQPLKDLIQRTGTAVVIIEHSTKRVPPSGHVLDCIGGNGSGLAAAARAAFAYGIDPDDADKRILAPAKFNIGRKPKALSLELDVEDIEYAGETPYLEVGEEVDGFDPMRLVKKDKGTQGETRGRPPAALTAACEWLALYLAQNGPTRAGDILEAAKHDKMSQKTLRRAADKLEVVRNPPKGGPKCTWDLNDEFKQGMGLPVTTVPDPTPTEGDIDAELRKMLGGDGV